MEIPRVATKFFHANIDSKMVKQRAGEKQSPVALAL